MSAPDKQEVLILAKSSELLSRALAYAGLADLDCARALAVEIRDHLDVIYSYALAKGISWELAEAQLNLIQNSDAEVVHEQQN